MTSFSKDGFWCSELCAEWQMHISASLCLNTYHLLHPWTLFSPLVSLTRPLSLPVFLSHIRHCLSLSEAQAFPSLPCLYYVPICVTNEACLRVKNKRWKGNRRMQGKWRGLRIWREEEGELASEAAACRKVINTSINSCLLMHLFTQMWCRWGLNAFCLAVSVVDTDLSLKPERWEIMGSAHNNQKKDVRCISWKSVCLLSLISIFMKAKWWENGDKFSKVNFSVHNQDQPTIQGPLKREMWAVISIWTISHTRATSRQDHKMG